MELGIVTPYRINLLKNDLSNEIQKATSTHCWIVKSSQSNGGVFIGKDKNNLTFHPLAENDLIVIHKNSYYKISNILEIIEFKNRFNNDLISLDDIPDVKVVNFNSIGYEYFFNQKDYSLQKINNDEVLCLAKESDFTVKCNIRTGDLKIFGTA